MADTVSPGDVHVSMDGGPSTEAIPDEVAQMFALDKKKKKKKTKKVSICVTSHIVYVCCAVAIVLLKK